MNLYGTVKVGGDVLAYCGKCKRELAHVVMAMVGGKPARVICKTCKSEHNYRSGQTPAKVSKAPRVQRTYVKNSDYWEQQMALKKQMPTKAYKVQEIFKLGDLINHSRFGIGIVEEVKNNGKIG